MGKYTRKNSTGDAGEYLVAYAFSGRLGWAYRILDSDTGIDGEVEIYNGEEPTGRLFKVQVKSAAKLRQTISKEEDDVEESDDEFSVSIKKIDMAYWRILALPVVLCIAHISTGRVYFKIIDSSVEIPENRYSTFSIAIDKRNEVTEAAHETLFRAAPLRNFNPLSRLLEQAAAKHSLLCSQTGDSYAYDKGVAIRQLKRESSALISRIRGLANLGGWVLGEATQNQVDRISGELNREVIRLERESAELEDS